MKELAYQEWIKNLQVGDVVYYKEGQREPIISTKIKKITEKGMIRVEHGDTLFQVSGYRFYGGKSSGIRLMNTDEAWKVDNERIKRKNANILLNTMYSEGNKFISKANEEQLEILSEYLYSMNEKLISLKK